MKFFVRLLLTLVLLGAIGIAAIYFLSQRRLDRHYAVDVETIAIPTDAAAIDKQ